MSPALFDSESGSHEITTLPGWSGTSNPSALGSQTAEITPLHKHTWGANRLRIKSGLLDAAAGTAVNWIGRDQDTQYDHLHLDSRPGPMDAGCMLDRTLSRRFQ